MIDLTERELAIVQGILARHVPDREVWVFGSRAGRARKPWSDLDLAILGDEKLAHSLLTAIEWDFEESDLPFKVDVADMSVVSPEFRSRIEAKHEPLPRTQKSRAAG